MSLGIIILCAFAFILFLQVITGGEHKLQAIRHLSERQAQASPVTQLAAANEAAAKLNANSAPAILPPALPSLPAPPTRIIEPYVASSEEMAERVRGERLHVILPFARVMELRKRFNDGKPRQDMVLPEADDGYADTFDIIPPAIVLEAVVEPWEHQVIAMAS